MIALIASTISLLQEVGFLPTTATSKIELFGSLVKDALVKADHSKAHKMLLLRMMRNHQLKSGKEDENNDYY